MNIICLGHHACILLQTMSLEENSFLPPLYKQLGINKVLQKGTITMYEPFKCRQHTKCGYLTANYNIQREIDMSANAFIYLNTSTRFTLPLH